MPIKKDYMMIRLRSGKLKICVGILITLAASILIRLTPLIENYWINFISAWIVSNGIGLCIIAALLMALHIVDLKRFKELLEKEDENNVN